MMKFQLMVVLLVVSLFLVSCGASMSNVSTSAVVYEIEEKQGSNANEGNITITTNGHGSLGKITTIVYP